jgi:gas vesicle protein
MSDERCCSGSGGILLAFLAGGMIGAGLALLYAPVSGREAREKIGGLAGDLKRKADEWSGDLKQKADAWSGDLKQKVEGFIEEEKSVIKAAYDAGRDAMAKEKARFENPQ